MYEPYRSFESDLALELGCDCHAMEDDFEMGRLLSGKVRRRIKKRLFKATLGPLALAHKITHSKNSPIRKAELKLQGFVGKVLPFTKPFIKAHNMIADKFYEGLEKVHIAKKGETSLAGADETSTSKTLLSDAASAYSKSGSSVNTSFSLNGKSVSLSDLTKAASNPKAAAAQMAASYGLNANLSSLVSSANISSLNGSPAFRQATLSQLVSKAKGGNSAAASVLARLKK